MTEHFDTRSKKGRGRGMAQRSFDLIMAMYTAAQAAQPITGRGVGYKLFTAGRRHRAPGRKSHTEISGT
jgi:hypothetical protein